MASLLDIIQIRKQTITEDWYYWYFQRQRLSEKAAQFEAKRRIWNRDPDRDNNPEYLNFLQDYRDFKSGWDQAVYWFDFFDQAKMDIEQEFRDAYELEESRVDHNPFEQQTHDLFDFGEEDSVPVPDGIQQKLFDA